jgi:hypothetical protein
MDDHLHTAHIYWAVYFRGIAHHPRLLWHRCTGHRLIFFSSIFIFVFIKKLICVLDPDP